MLCNSASGCKNIQCKSKPCVTNVTQSVLKNNVTQTVGVEIFHTSVRLRYEMMPTATLIIVLSKMPISGIKSQRTLQIIWTKP